MASTPPMPTTIAVGPFTYNVNTDPAALNERCREQASDLFGTCDHATRTIHLDATVHPQAINDTLVHESLHAIVSLVGFDWSTEREEAIVTRLSPAILGWLRSNPTLVAYLVA